jgi:hypothetical protein
MTGVEFIAFGVFILIWVALYVFLWEYINNKLYFFALGALLSFCVALFAGILIF